MTAVGWVAALLVVLLIDGWLWTLCRASALRERAWQESLRAAMATQQQKDAIR